MQSQATDEYVLLAGRPAIAEFVSFVKTRAADGPAADEGLLIREWRDANRYVRELETSEAGWADSPPLAPLPARTAALAESALEQAAVRQSFRLLPSRWSLVALDRLIVYQRHIDLGFVQELTRSFPSQPDDDEVMRIALGAGYPTPTVHLAKQSDSVYSFSSVSKDLRFLEVVPLAPSAISGHHPAGRAANAVAIFVGFGVNILSALHVQNRLILVNGSHRAYALRQLGFTHVPCLVQYASTPEEFDLVATPEMKQNAQLYLTAPRPPLFKDYFASQLRKVISVPRYNRVLHVRVTCEILRAPAD